MLNIYWMHTSAETEAWFIDSFEEWRKAKNISNFILLGHSFGGYVAAKYSLKVHHKWSPITIQFLFYMKLIENVPHSISFYATSILSMFSTWYWWDLLVSLQKLILKLSGLCNLEEHGKELSWAIYGSLILLLKSLWGKWFVFEELMQVFTDSVLELGFHNFRCVFARCSMLFLVSPWWLVLSHSLPWFFVACVLVFVIS